MLKQYAAVTPDRYELVIALADTVGELAQLTGCSKSVILSSITHACPGCTRGMRFIRFWIDDDPPEVYAPQRGFRLEDYVVQDQTRAGCKISGKQN